MSMSNVPLFNMTDNIEADANLQLPGPHCGKNENSFAYLTIKDRLPAILVRVIDALCRHKDEIRRNLGEVGIIDLKGIVGRLAKLRNELMTDKTILPITDSRDDTAIWNTFLEGLKQQYIKPSWYSMHWLYIECYMYRRIQESLELSNTLQTLDVFRWQKFDGFKTSLSSITTLVDFMDDTLSNVNTDDTRALALHFKQFLYIDLWGNKCDLSISGGVQNSQMTSPLDQLDQLHSHILVDHTSAIWDCLTAARHRNTTVTLHVVLDNAGFELITDLCLLEYLMCAGIVDKVHLHGKPFPWFISDVTSSDLYWTLDELVKSENDRLSTYGSKWKGYLNDKIWTYSAHTFWCLHFDYALMTRYAPELYDQLSTADLVLFKGDLNYRKLTGDLTWHPMTPFFSSLRGFMPAPLCTLRTLKADVIVGLGEGQDKKTEEIDCDWKTTGRWAVIQFARS